MKVMAEIYSHHPECAIDR